MTTSLPYNNDNNIFVNLPILLIEKIETVDHQAGDFLARFGVATEFSQQKSRLAQFSKGSSLLHTQDSEELELYVTEGITTIPIHNQVTRLKLIVTAGTPDPSQSSVNVFDCSSLENLRSLSIIFDYQQFTQQLCRLIARQNSLERLWLLDKEDVNENNNLFIVEVLTTIMENGETSKIEHLSTDYLVRTDELVFLKTFMDRSIFLNEFICVMQYHESMETFNNLCDYMKGYNITRYFNNRIKISRILY
ncbi:hypothetical protein PPL_06279 [Heterostelium album PN500]|uniref:Uncharacterized protein n=1 Tax=Heterostelium pallidum (strain ATCC 26659 / Pp 5 / PN500) TaxID=670386 RepID=D3BCQ3_HETP5|nr:hypothetical protein PPL_06279 [Heterostelium album PN500]EFA80695.1 hypothetical protein PPL_06279 [Heterostelium album PN500]|eukprot:XP_020432815.1 hypothetical protein PPL_06279 [Heterostelium album PN500]